MRFGPGQVVRSSGWALGGGKKDKEDGSKLEASQWTEKLDPRCSTNGEAVSSVSR